MRSFSTLCATVLAFVLVSSLSYAQPITRPAPFTLSARDTTVSRILPLPEAGPAGKHGAWHLTPDGHFGAADGTRMKFFGTELLWTANFLPAAESEVLAKRIHKLGFNALRLNNWDYFGWDAASIFRYYTDDFQVQPTSYVVNPIQLLRLDTLIANMKAQGVHLFLPLHAVHHWSSGDHVPTWDSTYNAGTLMPFIYPEAAYLNHEIAKALLTHVNPVTGLALGKDPAIACYEILQEQSLSFYWRLNRLNFVNSANALNGGLYTISYQQSRRLDTLFNGYLQRKYGTNSAVSQAWSGGSVDASNLMKNASFETFDNSNWALSNVAPTRASQSLYNPGHDDSPATLLHMIQVDTGAGAAPYGVVFVNSSAVCGKDSLYEFSFWAKVRYDPAHPVTQRSVVAYVAEPSSGGANLTQVVTIDTTWRKLSATFRTQYPGVQVAGIVMAGGYGDLLLDQFVIRHIAEQGLRSNESIANYSVVRLPYDSMRTVSSQRVRDLTMFYDSLERGYLHGMVRLLRDTLQVAGLVNTSQTHYWGSSLDYHALQDAEATESHAAWDYIRAGANGVYSDSSWMIENASMVKDNNFYYLATTAAASLAGRAHVLGLYTVPNVNQKNAEHAIIPTAYAAYQDWDGVFFGPYAGRYEELFSDTIVPGYTTYAWGNIEANHTFMSLMPAASAMFRNRLLAASTFVDTIKHDADDVWLLPHYSDGRGQFGQEGFVYGDQGIVTGIGVRQQFDTKVHQVAAENIYSPTDTLHHSDDNHISWNTTEGLFKAEDTNIVMFTGFPRDTIRFNKLQFYREDRSGDLLALAYIPRMPDSTGDERGFLTIATRTQNTGMKWHDTTGYSNSYGTAPTIMSAAKLTIAVRSAKDSVIIYPLDSTGNRIGTRIAAVPYGTGVSRWMSATIDQAINRSTWFDIVGTNQVAGVHTAPFAASDFRIDFRNGQTYAEFEVRDDAPLRLCIFDDLGRQVKQIDTERATDRQSVRLPVSELPTGHYMVRLQTPSGSISRHLNIVR